MISLKPISAVDMTEVLLGLLALLFSLYGIRLCLRTSDRKLSIGVVFLALFTLLETLDEFVVKSYLKDLLFNIPSRVFLLLGILFVFLSIKETFSVQLRSQRRKI